MAKKNLTPTTDPPALPPDRNAGRDEKPSFEQMMQNAMQHTLIDFLRKGDWLTIDYGNRIKLEAAFLRDVMQQIDMQAVIARVKEQLEQKIADQIMNSMQQEVANDVKSIMSNRELREDIRSVIRQKIRDCSASLQEGK
jgi:hypothetical protein